MRGGTSPAKDGGTSLGLGCVAPWRLPPCSLKTVRVSTWLHPGKFSLCFYPPRFLPGLVISVLCCILIPQMLLTLRCLRHTLLSRLADGRARFPCFCVSCRPFSSCGRTPLPPSVSGSISILDEVRILFVILPSFIGGGKKRKR